jgi:hypothetical protein
MKRAFVQALMILGGFTATSVSPAQIEGHPARWIALSTTAMGITGDIRSDPTGLTIAGHHLQLRSKQELSAEEIRDAASLFSRKGTDNLSGAIYRTYLGANTRLFGSNTLCGKKDTRWVVVMLSGPEGADHRRSLYLATFSGNNAPDLRPSAIDKSVDLCGTYWYERSN